METVEGCTHDGISVREHGQRYAEAVGWHPYVAPSQELLNERMLARQWKRAEERYHDALDSGLSDYEAREEGWPARIYVVSDGSSM